MQQAGRVIGPYKLTEQLGRGGMGVVWRARDTLLDRDVAIKMLVPSADDTITRENSQRFLVEAKAAANIKSRHIAQVLQLGSTDEGEAYIVMELLDGKTLLHALMRERKFTPERAVRIGRQIARGMSEAHAIGIVHRDLKPANVMLVSADGESEVAKVLDFGVAKRLGVDSENITQQGALLGTLQFMAPEQVTGGAVDARTDIYALGVLLYRMLSGHVPFEAESLAEMVRVHLSVEPKSLTERVPELPGRLDAVVQRCLKKSPGERWQTMSELEQALATVFDDAAVVVKDADAGTTLPSSPANAVPAAGASAAREIAGNTNDPHLLTRDMRREPTPAPAGANALVPASAASLAQPLALSESSPPTAPELTLDTDRFRHPAPDEADSLRHFESSLRTRKLLVRGAAAAGVVLVVASVVAVLMREQREQQEQQQEQQAHVETPAPPAAAPPAVAAPAASATAPSAPTTTAPAQDAPVQPAEAKPVVAKRKSGATRKQTAAESQDGAVAEGKAGFVRVHSDGNDGFVRVHTKEGE